MNIRAVTTGDVIDLNDDGARQLIDAGIYEAVVRKGPAPKVPPKTPTPPAPKAPSPGTSTKVAPLTTTDMPATPTPKAK